MCTRMLFPPERWGPMQYISYCEIVSWILPFVCAEPTLYLDPGFWVPLTPLLWQAPKLGNTDVFNCKGINLDSSIFLGKAITLSLIHKLDLSWLWFSYPCWGIARESHRKKTVFELLNPFSRGICFSFPLFFLFLSIVCRFPWQQVHHSSFLHSFCSSLGPFCYMLRHCGGRVVTF